MHEPNLERCELWVGLDFRKNIRCQWDVWASGFVHFPFYRTFQVSWSQGVIVYRAPGCKLCRKCVAEVKHLLLRHQLKSSDGVRIVTSSRLVFLDSQSQNIYKLAFETIYNSSQAVLWIHVNIPELRRNYWFSCVSSCFPLDKAILVNPVVPKFHGHGFHHFRNTFSRDEKTIVCWSTFYPANGLPKTHELFGRSG